MKSIKKSIAIGLIGFIVFFPYMVMAQIPEIPLVIEGDVSIGGSSAASGTIVSAFIDGAQRAQHIVANPGRYALAVSGSSATDKNKTIKLFVNGVDTSSTTMWKSGEIVTINLSIAAQSSGSTTSSSGGSSDGSGAITQTSAPVATSYGAVATQTPVPVPTSDGAGAGNQTPASVATSDVSATTQTPVKSADGPTAILSLFIIIVIFWMRGQKR